MTDSEKINDIYLDLSIRKSVGKTDEFGNYFFEVEASNENLDLQNQIVLQNALLESKNEFLRGGVISYDHLHKIKDENGRVISDPKMVIGEPVEVKTKGKSTIVVGKLYAHNEKAKTLIKMLKDGSTRVRASVGGIFPEIIKDAKTGVEKIAHVIWNDLALTTSPVNNTVGAAVFAKSMTSEEFVKALTAGYGTDSSAMSGGRSLIKEDLNTKLINTLSESDSKDKEIIRSLVAALKTGEVKGEKQAEKFLVDFGVDKDKSHKIVCEIIKQGGQMMKKSFYSSVSELLKSLTGQKDEDKEKFDDEDIELDDSDFEDSEDEDDIDEEDDETNKSNCKKSDSEDDDIEEDDDDDDDEETVDGTEVLKSLSSELMQMRKLAKSQSAMIKDLGNAVTGLAEMVYAIGNEKMPPKTTFAKSFSSGSEKKSYSTQAKPSLEDVDTANDLLCTAVMEGRLSIEKSSLISTDLQKSLHTGQPMKPEYYEFLREEFRKGGK